MLVLLIRLIRVISDLPIRITGGRALTSRYCRMQKISTINSRIRHLDFHLEKSQVRLDNIAASLKIKEEKDKVYNIEYEKSVICKTISFKSQYLRLPILVS